MGGFCLLVELQRWRVCNQRGYPVYFEIYPALNNEDFKKLLSSSDALFSSYYNIVEDETLSLIQEHWKPNKTLKVIGCVNPLVKRIYYLGCCKHQNRLKIQILNGMWGQLLSPRTRIFWSFRPKNIFLMTR